MVLVGLAVAVELGAIRAGSGIASGPVAELGHEGGCEIRGRDDAARDQDRAEALPRHALLEERILELLVAHKAALDNELAEQRPLVGRAHGHTMLGPAALG